MDPIMSQVGRFSKKDSAVRTKIVASPKIRWKVDKRGVDDSQVYSPVGAAFLQKGVLVVSEVDNERIQLFDDQCLSFDTIGEGDVKPRGLVVDHVAATIAVTDDREKTIKMFTFAGERDFSWKRNLFKKPHGLAISPDDNYIVTDVAESAPKIGVFDPDGNNINWFGSGNESKTDAYIESPNYVTCDSHGRVIVSDFTCHCIRVFDQNGKVILKFGTKGEGNGNLKYPNGVAVDFHDNILVADNGNQRVSLFGPSGKFIEHILTPEDGISWPEALAISDSGLLAVTQSGIDHDAVKVFEI